MSSISTTISSLAATNPIVGNAVAYANKQSQILSTLSGSASASVSLQNLLTSANTQSLGGVTVLPTATGAASAATDPAASTDAATDPAASTDAATDPAASTDAATADAASGASAPDFSGNSALLIADNQSIQSSQLLSSLTGVGGTFSGAA